MSFIYFANSISATDHTLAKADVNSGAVAARGVRGLLDGMFPEEVKELLHVIATHSASTGQCHSELV